MIFVTVECSCTMGDEYPNGGKPEFYDSIRLATARWVDHKQLRSLYWSVHCKGAHIVNVINELPPSPLSWCEYKEIK